MSCFSLAPDSNGKITIELRNEIIAGTQLLKPTAITFEKIRISNATKKLKQSESLYSALHGENDFVSKDELLLVHFITPDGNLGVIGYSKTIECDRPWDAYYFYVVTKQGIVSQPISIRATDNSYGIYERRFKFPSDSVLQLSVKRTSEWAVEDPTKQDTLFTDLYQLSLAKASLDTIKTMHFQEILKPDSAHSK
ncbi:MAG: hypothetical protein ACJ77K_12310 [Bacteroidia bacterium]